MSTAGLVAIGVLGAVWLLVALLVWDQVRRSRPLAEAFKVGALWPLGIFLFVLDGFIKWTCED